MTCACEEYQRSCKQSSGTDEQRKKLHVHKGSFMKYVTLEGGGGMRQA